MTDFDRVARAKHYNVHPSGIECIVLVRLCPFSLGNAIKYVWRAGEKNDIIEDLKKAIWYLDDYTKALDREFDSPPQIVAAGRIAERVQDQRNGNLEGFLRALYGGLENGGPWRFTYKSRVNLASLFVEGMIDNVKRERVMK